ncbi:MAG: class I tRNA ligase family protein [Crocinitomicaceae bacterium]|nr:class I tRNA ligase family protein [Crocinitomicaceae bacterium]
MQWKSPWGQGFPGWHIECTAMSSKYLGIPFDIHGGGMDLKFPHHEAEICQSLGAFDKPPVNYWLHNNMVTLNGQKMAKSKGNYITLTELFEGKHELLKRAYSPMVVRFFILQAHYGSTIDFSNESLIAAENALHKLELICQKLSSINSNGDESEDVRLENEINSGCEKCYEAMNDDFNTAKLIAALFELSRLINKVSENKLSHHLSKACVEKLVNTYSSFWRDVLGMREEQNQSEIVDDVLQMVLELRKKAKEEKNYAFSDFIRQKLETIGVQLQDGKDGTINFTIK